MVTCDLWIARKFQFCKSIFSKFWIILELEIKILINFSTPKNPNITFLDRSRNTRKSRCSFSFKPPIMARTKIWSYSNNKKCWTKCFENFSLIRMQWILPAILGLKFFGLLLLISYHLEIEIYSNLYTVIWEKRNLSLI